MNTTMKKLEFNEMSRIEGGWTPFKCLMAPMNLMLSAGNGVMTAYYVGMSAWCLEN